MRRMIPAIALLKMEIDSFYEGRGVPVDPGAVAAGAER
jgi:hypothetical protein